MSLAEALAVTTIAVAAFGAGRLSAARALRRLREALTWRERFDTFPLFDDQQKGEAPDGLRIDSRSVRRLGGAARRRRRAGR